MRNPLNTTAREVVGNALRVSQEDARATAVDAIMVRLAQEDAAALDKDVRRALESFGWGDVLDVHAYTDGPDYLQRSRALIELCGRKLATYDRQAGLLHLTDAGRAALYSDATDSDAPRSDWSTPLPDPTDE